GDRAHDAYLELARVARLDQLTAEGAQQRLRNRRQPQLAHPLERTRRLADQRIAREAPQELRVVGVDRHDETELLEPLVALCPEDDAPVDQLRDGADFDPLPDAQRRRERPVALVARRVARVPERLRE